ncbi:MAG: ATP-binding cassette domain-containing protein, partial [Metamycoplasmataceae bacterium]
MLLNVKKPLFEDDLSSDSSNQLQNQTNIDNNTAAQNTAPHNISKNNNSEMAVEMINITKEFPGIKANDDINLAIRRGSIHALVGENGAGKSTLMSILFGIYKPTLGSIKIDGSTVLIDGPNQANDMGIGMVHQHFKLVGNYTNFENIILGAEFEKKGFLDRETSLAKIKLLQNKFGLRFDLDEITSDAPVVTRQKIEILKMLYRDAEILIFDEPTAVLAPKEIDEFLNILGFLKQNGKTILFITHKLWEVMKVSDEITVIRHGKVVKHYESIENITTTEIANWMVGENVVYAKNQDQSYSDDIILKLENVFSGDKLKNLSLEVHAG